jgi:release factor glutamine methyltransferase
METMPTLSELMQTYRKELAGHYPGHEIRDIFSMVSEHIQNYSKIDIHLKSQEPISAPDLEKYNQSLIRLRNWEPVQYVVGHAEFYGLCYHVDPRVLIPRPETELLVEWIIREESGRQTAFLDLGTGSGCIAVSLAVNLPGSRVSACDVSEDALAVARLNAFNHHAEVEFFYFNLLEDRAYLPAKFQVMVSNPPYVREQEKVFMRNNVLDFEPPSALFVPDHDPLVFYRRIALLGRKYLTDGGSLYLEINENFPHEIVRVLESTGFYGTEIRTDLNGKPRMIRSRK